MPKTGDIKSIPRLTPFYSDAVIEIGVYKNNGMIEYFHAVHKPSKQRKRFEVDPKTFDIVEQWQKMEKWFAQFK